MNNIYDSEIARLGTVSYRCFARLHQILITLAPYLHMPPNEHAELSQLTYELLRTIHQLNTPTETPQLIIYNDLDALTDNL